MPLKYKLVKSNLKSKEDIYVAKPVSRDKVTQDDLIERMIGRGSGITKAEALANLEAYHQVLCEAVQNGEMVVTEMFSIQSSITGRFNNFNSSFTPELNEVKIRLQPGRRLQNVALKIDLQKKNNHPINPVIHSIRDRYNKHHAMKDKAGGFIIIKGERLKINVEDEQQGLFFISNETQQEYKVTNLINNKPSELMLLIPEIPEGEYMIELRVVFRNSKMLRKVQHGSGFVIH